jgi:hypothetical protein
MIDLSNPIRFAGYEPNVDVELHNDPQYDVGTLQRIHVNSEIRLTLSILLLFLDSEDRYEVGTTIVGIQTDTDDGTISISKYHHGGLDDTAQHKHVHLSLICCYEFANEFTIEFANELDIARSIARSSILLCLSS